ncbi:hypothetical protein TNCV_1316921 [Trichonephila clavipes]|nr:hypothetical protein TNCV_1316921 [Trichonephila clavipes]
MPPAHRIAEQMRVKFVDPQSPNVEVKLEDSATQGLLATDLLILSHGQVKRTTSKLARLSPNFHTTPTGGRLNLALPSSTRWVFSGTRPELLTRRPRVRYLGQMRKMTLEMVSHSLGFPTMQT